MDDYRCDNYLIFYRYEDGVVYVVRILYGRRNFIRVLFSNLLEEEK
ncbi:MULTISPECIES: type II toxin-antitoxin system RelE/ParE family toxin [Paenibacillus]|nr:type II toxin-antitoxin system RelE/ParE family toxin [Paenibacillus macerans]